MLPITLEKLSVSYRAGFLWKLSDGANELVRMIYFALRDENWGTYPLTIEDEKIHHDPNSFGISYTAFNIKNDTKIFQWSAVIEGDNNGTITFELAGKALADVLKNRAGFCIHHPVKELKGKPCELGDSSGAITQKVFPKYIAPENPFKDIQSMGYTVGRTTVDLKFEGDVFEMEDQRNWTDASFKTFCTPLNLPFPVLLKKGDTIHQRITIQIKTESSTSAVGTRNIKLSRTSMPLRIPSIGTGSSIDNLTTSSVTAIKNLALSQYRIEAHAATPDWENKLQTEIANARTLGLPIELAYVHNNHVDALRTIRDVVRSNKEVTDVALFSHDRPISPDFSQFAADLKAIRSNLSIGGGTLYNFAELNRNRFNASWMDYITFSIHPQEHSFDDLTILENVEAQYDAVESARHLYPGVEIRVSPLTLKKRYNPYATRADKRIIPPTEQNDPRQHTRFASLFMLGSIKHLALAGASSVTLFEAIGDRGLIIANGDLSDCYHWLRLLTSPSVMILEIQSPEPLLVDGFLTKDTSQGKETLCVWNYSAQAQKVEFDGNVLSIASEAILTIEL